MIGREDVVAALSPFLRFGPTDPGNDNIPAFCPFHKGGMERSPALYIYVGPTTAKLRIGTAFCHTCKRSWSLNSMLAELGVGKGSLPMWLHLVDEEAKEARESAPPDRLEFHFHVLPEQVLGVFSYMPKLMVEWGYSPVQLRRHDIGFDRSAKRIIFPIRNHLGELVGVSGRTVCDDIPRYKVYRSEFQDVIRGYSLDKGQVLWGLDKIYQGYMLGVLDSPIVVCEGFKACLSIERAGFTAVALLGSYLTKQQRYLLERVATDVVVFLDNDEAGVKGTAQILESELGCRVRVAQYPTDEKSSPDDLTEEGIRVAIGAAQLPILWRYQHGYFGQAGGLSGLAQAAGGRAEALEDQGRA